MLRRLHFAPVSHRSIDRCTMLPGRGPRHLQHQPYGDHCRAGGYRSFNVEREKCPAYLPNAFLPMNRLSPTPLLRDPNASSYRVLSLPAVITTA